MTIFGTWSPKSKQRFLSTSFIIVHDLEQPNNSLKKNKRKIAEEEKKDNGKKKIAEEEEKQDNENEK